MLYWNLCFEDGILLDILNYLYNIPTYRAYKNIEPITCTWKNCFKNDTFFIKRSFNMLLIRYRIPFINQLKTSSILKVIRNCVSFLLYADSKKKSIIYKEYMYIFFKVQYGKCKWALYSTNQEVSPYYFLTGWLHFLSSSWDDKGIILLTYISCSSSYEAK